MLMAAGCGDPWIRPIGRVSEVPAGAGAPANGSAANGTFSAGPSMSNDGGVVTLISDATNLVAGDTNGQVDGFAREGAAAPLKRISLSSTGAQSNGRTFAVSVSGDGKLAAFVSDGSNLVAGDTNAVRDVFVRDLTAGTTERVSVSSAGTQANDGSFGVAISDDGRYVAFDSFASNLVANDTNNTNDVFVRDRVSGTTERVSISSGGTQGNQQSAGPVISADGRFVAWGSGATNLVTGDTNATYDGFIRDRQTGTTERFNVSSSEVQAENGVTTWWGGQAISDDGRYVTFIEDATNLVPFDTNGERDVFVRDRQAGTTEKASVSSLGIQGDGHAQSATLAGNGRFVVFMSDATNMVSGDTDGVRNVFIRDRTAGTTERVDTRYDGAQPDNHAQFGVAISNDGRFVAFDSTARLTPRDTSTEDVFVRDVTRPGYDGMFTTSHTPGECVDLDSELPKFYCRTDDTTLTWWSDREPEHPDTAFTEDQEQRIRDTVLQQYNNLTVLDTIGEVPPVFEGDTETDVIYVGTVFPGEDENNLGLTYCDDAVGGTDKCDQEYVWINTDNPGLDAVFEGVICHETGHAVGLTHGDDADPSQDPASTFLNGCMATPTLDNTLLGGQNVDQIDGAY
jgi:hypothetical protein